MARQRGFTLVELIVVMVVTGILAGILVVFFRPAFSNYLATGRRAALSDAADGAMRRMERDIRSAVPNSVRQQTITNANGTVTQYLEIVPTISGGRFRAAPETVWDAANPASPSMPLDTNAPGSGFDVLTTLNPMPSAGDWVVIGNQDPSDLHGASGTPPGPPKTITQIQSIVAAPSPQTGTARIKLTGTAVVPPGYDAGRFVVVSNALRAVSFICDSPGINTQGTGTGTLFRVPGVNFSPVQPTPTPTAANILANKIRACSFNYSANAGGTQDNGLVEITLQLTDQNESVTLYYSVHVDNAP
jgi:MSHA biogenesis protein MshO